MWRKKKIIEEIFSDKVHLLTKSFLILLSDKRREALILNIIEEYRKGNYTLKEYKKSNFALNDKEYSTYAMNYLIWEFVKSKNDNRWEMLLDSVLIPNNLNSQIDFSEMEFKDFFNFMITLKNAN